VIDGSAPPSAEERRDEEAADDSQAPADLAAGRMNEAAEDAADARNTAIQEEEESRGCPDQ
jgi:hypothetical protein